MEMLYVAVLVFSMMACGHGQKTMNVVNTTYVEVKASGIKMMASKQMNISIDKNALTVELKGLEEKNATDMLRQLNMTGLTFTTGDATDVASGAGVIASRQIMTASGDTDVLGAKLSLTFDIFKAAGTITRDTEKTNVTKGDVKISAKLTGYTFPAETEMLKLSLSISGSKADPSMIADNKMTDGVAYDLGGDGLVMLSKKEMEDAAYVAVMPMMNKQMMTVTFNKTGSAVPIEYSIVLKPATVSVDEDDKDPNSSTRVASLGLYLWFMLLAHRILW